MLVTHGTLWTSHTLKSADTSGSWGWAVKGSLKKITRLTFPSAILPPICWSPPYGPERYLFTSSPVASEILRPVVPVAISSYLAKVSLCFLQIQSFHLFSYHGLLMLFS